MWKEKRWRWLLQHGRGWEEDGSGKGRICALIDHLRSREKPHSPSNFIVRLKRLIHSPLNGLDRLDISRSPEGSIALSALAVIKNERDLIVNLDKKNITSKVADKLYQLFYFAFCRYSGPLQSANNYVVSGSVASYACVLCCQCVTGTSFM